jgi:hypothetical protein
MKTLATHHIDIAIAVAAGTYPLGRAARTAHAWQESLHSRAALRAERYGRGRGD